MDAVILFKVYKATKQNQYFYGRQIKFQFPKKKKENYKEPNTKQQKITKIIMQSITDSFILRSNKIDRPIK